MLAGSPAKPPAVMGWVRAGRIAGISSCLVWSMRGWVILDSGGSSMSVWVPIPFEIAQKKTRRR
jgi:hypothetical protein